MFPFSFVGFSVTLLECGSLLGGVDVAADVRPDGVWADAELLRDAVDGNPLLEEGADLGFLGVELEGLLGVSEAGARAVGGVLPWDAPLGGCGLGLGAPLGGEAVGEGDGEGKDAPEGVGEGAALDVEAARDGVDGDPLPVAKGEEGRDGLHIAAEIL